MRFVVVALVLAACVDTGPGPAPRVDAKYARAHLLKAVPADLEKLDVAVGDRAIYLGNKIDRTRLAPGQSLVIKHYWKVLKPVGKGWRPFALVRGPPGSADFMNLELTDMQIAHPLEKWKAGEIIEDEQQITIRPDWQSPYAFVYVGLIEVGRHTTLDRMAVTGARTQDRAIVAAKLEVDLSRAPPPVGTIHIPRASGPVTIDGMQIDQPWVTAITSPEFVTADGSPDPSGKATAKLLWDDQYLYVFMNIIDTDIGSPYKNHDDSLWKADAIEMFIDADGNRAGYIEVQVNPHNTQFDSFFAGPRGSQGDVPWQSNMVTAVKVRGTPDPGDTDVGWDVEIGIPWTAVRGRDDKMAVQLPPRLGDRWKINIVRVDVKSGSDRQSASSWNRIGYGDWHGLDKMLTAVFADPTGSIVPPPESPNPPPPGLAPGQQGSGSGSNSPAPPN
ncbi:MAG: carbohydrate-binding family 9-like protein [Myxococcota bacterium]|nr:carbohydrate-binding family 9-like protein [Myxococcota bacterium]